MIMKKYFLACIVSVFSFGHVSAISLPLLAWKNAVVKIVSYPCQTRAPEFQGTGILVNVNSHLEVITSEHILLQDNSGRICFEVRNEKMATSFAKIDAISLMKGLARLSVTDDQLKDFAIDIQALSKGNEGDQVISVSALGFPFDSEQLQILNEGSVITEKSKRALLPEVTDMIEASGLPVEFGMSGGVLLAKLGPDSFAFKGLLSHQVLRRLPGKSTKVEIINSQSNVSAEDLVLAIPSIEMQNDNWRRDLNAQLNNREVFSNGVLNFELKKEAATELFSIGGADGSGIGGSDGPTAEFLGVVNVTLDQKATYEQKVLILNDPLLEKWKNWLLQGKSFEIIFLRGSGHRLISINSLSQFFTLWKRDQYIPVSLRTLNDTEVDKKLHSYSQQVVLIAQKARDNAGENELKTWFGLVRDMAILADQKTVSSFDVLELLDGANDIYWKQYYDANFDDAVLLESSIKNLVEFLKKIGI